MKKKFVIYTHRCYIVNATDENEAYELIKEDNLEFEEYSDIEELEEGED